MFMTNASFKFNMLYSLYQVKDINRTIYFKNTKATQGLKYQASIADSECRANTFASS